MASQTGTRKVEKQETRSRRCVTGQREALPRRSQGKCSGNSGKRTKEINDGEIVVQFLTNYDQGILE